MLTFDGQLRHSPARARAQEPTARRPAEAEEPQPSTALESSEPRFGHDLSRMRVHADPSVAAPALARVQLKGGEPELSDAQVQSKAVEGIGGSSGSIPYQSQMERGFNTSFADVRVHTDTHAAQASHSISALAYTRGNHVAFATPSPSPELVAHELAHVVQQRAGAGPAGGISQPGDSYEREADTAAATVSAGRATDLVARYGLDGGPTGAVQRQTVQRFEENEHKQMGDEGAGSAAIKLNDEITITFGDLTAMAGDYFGGPDELFDLLYERTDGKVDRSKPKKGDGKNKAGTPDEVIFVLQVHIAPLEKKKKEEDFGPDVRKAVKERFYRLATYNPTHFTNVEAGDEKLTHDQLANKRGPDKKPINNSGSYRVNHENAIRSAVKAAGGPRDEALVYEGFASHYITDAHSSGHLRTNRASIPQWWNPRVPMFWTNLQWWMAEQIAKHVNDNNWRGNVATVDYMWQEARGTIAKKLKDKGIPAMSFADVVSGAVHDLDNKNGVIAQLGGDTVKLVGDHQVLDDKGQQLPGGLETGKRAAAAVRESMKDITDAWDKGKAGETDAEKVLTELRAKGAGMFRAEVLWPKALPDSTSGQGATPKWQVDSVDQLFAEPTMKAALRLFANNKADTLGKEMKMEEQYEEDALHKGVLDRLRGGEDDVIKTFNEIINYIPDTGGHGGYPILQSPIDNNSDDNAMEYFEVAKKQGALKTLTVEQRIKAIRFLVSGVCTDEEEQAIIEMLDTATVPQMVSIVRQLGRGDVKKGVDYLDSGIDGAEWDTLCARVLSKSPETAVHMDDDGARAAVKSGAADKATPAAKIGMIQQLMDGACGDDDEVAIIRIIQATAAPEVRTIVDGVGYGRFWDKIDGAESRQMSKLLRDKGYFQGWSVDYRVAWIKYMSSGATGDSAQELICCILESSTAAEVKAIDKKVGSLDWDLTGSHQDRYDAVKKASGL